jgi:DNA-binding response OmpR family regulator
MTRTRFGPSSSVICGRKARRLSGAVLTAEAPYDLVVTNNCMPRMEGEELIARIREARPDLPMLHLDDVSGSHQPLLSPDVPNLTKPFNMDTLVS